MPSLPLVELADATLCLRPWAEADLSPLLRALADPDIPRFTLWSATMTEAQVRERMAASERQRRIGERLELVVTRAGGHDLVGFIGLAPLWEDARAEVFWTAPWARRRGVASGALRLLCRWAVTELGLARLELRADEDNEASQRAARAVGFSPDGRLAPTGRVMAGAWATSCSGCCRAS